MTNAFIAGGIRTPIGNIGGALSEVRTDDLAAHAIRDGYVQPDSRDGHTHLLTRLECS